MKGRLLLFMFTLISFPAHDASGQDWQNRATEGSFQTEGSTFHLRHHYNPAVLQKLNLTWGSIRFHALLASRDRLRLLEFNEGGTWRTQRMVGISGSESREGGVEGRRGLSGGDSVNSQPLFGNLYPNGLYYTQIALGSPPQSFHVNVDTGSNLLWVNCYPCQPCTSSRVQQLSPPFDSGRSSTTSPLLCNATLCHPRVDPTVGVGACAAGPTSHSCAYSVGYADGSGSSGTLLRDVIWMKGHKPHQMLFGCGNSQTGHFANGPGWTIFAAIDGLLGLGRGKLSALNFLQEAGIPNVFTLCLGGGSGGGVLSLGASLIPPHVRYTPMTKNSSFYKVGLLHIQVAGHGISVPPSVYGDVTAGNAVFDSGTTSSAVPMEVQTRMIRMMAQRVQLPPSINNPPGPNAGLLCFTVPPRLSVESVISRFPTLNLQFVGQGVFLNVPPQSYTFTLTQPSPSVCTQLMLSTPPNPFIIGANWMRNVMMVHDNEEGRMGWAPQNCEEEDPRDHLSFQMRDLCFLI